jgi:U3 small nucleolar RNA-associated protein 18
MGALKAQQEREGGMQLTLHSDAESASADEEDEEGDLNNMADADVCYSYLKHSALQPC